MRDRLSVSGRDTLECQVCRLHLLLLFSKNVRVYEAARYPCEKVPKELSVCKHPAALGLSQVCPFLLSPQTPPIADGAKKALDCSCDSKRSNDLLMHLSSLIRNWFLLQFPPASPASVLGGRWLSVCRQTDLEAVGLLVIQQGDG